MILCACCNPPEARVTAEWVSGISVESLDDFPVEVVNGVCQLTEAGVQTLESNGFTFKKWEEFGSGCWHTPDGNPIFTIVKFANYTPMEKEG